MKIKVRVLPTNGGGAKIDKKDQRKIDKLMQQKIKFEIEFIYNKIPMAYDKND